ncbi:MAG: tRNA pseudouridine(55) synthase TruB [Thermomicrobiaceae bacterium]
MELHGFLNVDKPLGWTSHDVVGRLRRILNTKKIGHAGTLDPAATGVVVVGVGRATRFLDYVQHGSKSYIAHVVLGIESESADIDGRALAKQEPSAFTDRRSSADLTGMLDEFTGEIDQVPPKYSAIKQGGEPLYRRMRRGEDVDVPIRRVWIESIELLFHSYPDLVLNVRCGPGVYIRSLARDIGERLGTDAYLHHLVRTHVGRFHLSESLSLEYLSSVSVPESWTAIASATDSGVDESPALYLDEQGKDAWYHGRSVAIGPEHGEVGQIVRAYDTSGAFAGIASPGEGRDSATRIRPRIVIASN